MAIICEDKCKCGVNFVKDPSCSGDYYPTIYGIVLQRFCPECGRMKPLLSERDTDSISNNEKKRIAVRVATAYRLGYIEVKEIASSLKIMDREKFFVEFAMKIGLSKEQIIRCAM